MTAPQRLRAVLAEPGLIVMPAVYDGLSAKLTAEAERPPDVFWPELKAR